MESIPSNTFSINDNDNRNIWLIIHWCTYIYLLISLVMFVPLIINTCTQNQCVHIRDRPPSNVLWDSCFPDYCLRYHGSIVHFPPLLKVTYARTIEPRTGRNVITTATGALCKGRRKGGIENAGFLESKIHRERLWIEKMCW